jgi:hypothetical protein
VEYIDSFSDDHERYNQYCPISEERFIDKVDDHKYFKFSFDSNNQEVCTSSMLGCVDQKQIYYFKCEPNKFFVNKTTAQISGIRYDHDKQKFYGLEIDQDDPNKTRHVQLSDIWMETNFPDIMQQLKKNYKDQKKRYFMVPLADSYDATHYKNQNKHNPLIRYRQFKEKTCAFDSLASSLAYLKYFNQAESINAFKYNFLESKYLDNFFRIAEDIINYIRNGKDFKPFRKRYKIFRLERYHNVFDKSSIGYEDIRFLQLCGTDGSVSHAICIVGDFIFDSNCKYALSFTEENLNQCCNGFQFSFIVKGWIFKRV